MKKTLILLLALFAATQAYAAPKKKATKAKPASVADPTLAVQNPATTEGEINAALTGPNDVNLTDINNNQIAADALIQQDYTRTAYGVFTAVNVGTQGVGFDLGYEFNRHLKLRYRAAFLSYNYNTDWEGADVSAKLSGNNNGLILDVHPFGGTFRVSAGFNFNPFKIEAHATMNDNIYAGYYGKVYNWGNYSYKVEEGNGWANARYSWRSFQPYLGIGWSSDGEGDRSLYFTFDLGLNFMGNGSFSVNASSNVMQAPIGSNNWTPVDNAMLRDSIMEEGKDFFKIADKIYVYPVMQIGLGFRF